MIDEKPVRRQPSPWTIAFVLLLVTLFSFQLIGPFIGMAIAYPFYDGKPMDFLGDIADPAGNDQMKMLLMIIQGSGTLFGLAIIPTLFRNAIKHEPALSLFKGPDVRPIYFLMTIGIVITFLGPGSVIMQWNQGIDFPDGAFEQWAKGLEEQLAEFTKYMTSFNNFGEYLLGVLVMAILPAFGEEMVFRGIIQPEFQKAFKNVHAGIWVSAIFFSAFHLQFYGFVPRVMLGALFGYMYYWSGNLYIPIFAHFINNWFAVSAIYLGLSDVPGLEEENTTAMPWYAVAILTTLCGLLIYRFRTGFLNRTLPNDVSTQ